MVTPKSPWSVKGVPQETRAAAKIAARRAGLTIGQWLSRAIMETARRDVSGEAVAPADLPVVRPEPAPPAAREQLERDARELHAVVAGVQQLKQELGAKLAQLDACLAEDMAVDLAGLERRLEAIEARADNARLLVAPLERQLQQIVERLSRLDGGPARHRRPADAEEDDWDLGRSRGGLFARLFDE